MQERSAPSHLARMIAANNVVNAAGMAAGAVLTAGLALAGVAPVTILVTAAVANLLVAAWIVRILPQETVRARVPLVLPDLPRGDVAGLENLPPPDRRAVIVVNHQSFLDGCFVAAFLPGAPTFAVNVHIAARWWARPFLAAVRTSRSTRPTRSAPRRWCARCATARRWWCSPRAGITTTGALMKVYEGAGMVADKAGAVIVPCASTGCSSPSCPAWAAGRRAAGSRGCR